MIDFVLRHIAFSRSPRGKARVLLFLLALGTVGLVAGSSMAAGPAPTIAAARTLDADGDGFIEAIVVTFDRAMDTAVTTPRGFEFTAPVYAPRDGDAGLPSKWLSPNDNPALPTTQLQLYLMPNTVASLPLGDTGITPTITYHTHATAPVRSAGGQGIGEPLAEGASVVTTDGAKPALMQAVAADFGSFDQGTHGIFNMPSEWAKLSFSESIKLAGATAADRHVNLEKALKISNGVGCQATDGDGVSVHNFPRGGSPSSDAITSPLMNDSSRFIRVELKPETGATGHVGTTPLSNVPGVCKVGIDSAGANAITDLASPPNAASPEGANRRDIGIAPSSMIRLETRDLFPAPPNGAPTGDGTLDAIAISFDQPLLDSSINDGLASQFVVKSNGVPATVASVTSGTADDDTLIVHVAALDWNGQTKPRIAFTGTGCQLKTKIPSPTYSACAEGFGYVAGVFEGIEAVDKIAPVFKTAQTVDGNGNGLIDGAQLTFSEPLMTATTQGWTVDGANISAITMGADTKTASITFPEGSGGDSGRTPSVRYEPGPGTGTVDGDNNEIGLGTVVATDGAAPLLIKATSFDVNGDGKIDTATLQFSEAVNEGASSPADFKIGELAASAFGTSPIDTGAGADLVTVTGSGQPLGTDHVKVGYTGTTLLDLASLPVPAKTIDAADVVDAAAPVAMISTTPVSPFKGGSIAVKATFTEVMDSTVIPTVVVNGGPSPKDVTPVADIDHANGFRNGDKSIWDGAVTLDDTDCAAQNGCDLEITLDGGKDMSANTTVAGAKLPVNVDAVEPDKATGLALTAVQDEGFAPIAANTIGGATTQLSLTASIVAGQVNQVGQTAGGSAEILLVDLDGDHSLTPVAKVESISSTADTVTVTTAFESIDALQEAIPEPLDGVQPFKIRLCDGAGNCSVSDPVDVTVDYTPVDVALESPNSGTLQGNSVACITWDGDEADDTLQNVEILYSIDGGDTFPNLIASGLEADGVGPCDGSGTAQPWTVPLINTTQLRVLVATIDSFNNVGFAVSEEDITIQTTYALTHRASATVIVAGGPVTFSGTYKGNNVPVVGRPVTIQRRIKGQSAWQTLVTVTTNSSGAYAWTGRPGSNADWRTITSSGNGYPSLTSPTSYVAVRVVLNFVASPTSLPRGKYTTLSGSVVPAKRGIVQLQMYAGGGKWIKIAQTNASATGGFRFTYRLPSAGGRTFRVFYGQQDVLHAGNYSVNRVVYWR